MTQFLCIFTGRTEWVQNIWWNVRNRDNFQPPSTLPLIFTELALNVVSTSISRYINVMDVRWTFKQHRVPAGALTIDDVPSNFHSSSVQPNTHRITFHPSTANIIHIQYTPLHFQRRRLKLKRYFGGLATLQDGKFCESFTRVCVSHTLAKFDQK